MYASAGSVADFTGVLIRRQYKPGQKYIQLLFKNTEGLQLSLTRNIQLVRSLHEGQTYRVKGQEFIVGQKTVVHEPIATLVQPKTVSRRWIFVLLAVFLTSGGIVGALTLLRPNSAANSNQTESKNTPMQSQQTTKMPRASGEQPGPTAENQPNTAQSSSNTTTKKTTPKSSQPSYSAAASQPPANSSSSDPTSPPAAPPSPDPAPAPPPEPPTNPPPDPNPTDPGT
jgi:cytoskeletal protein RodZ